MAAATDVLQPEFHFDLAGRVRNLSLPASSANALIPLFEAITNSIHAVEARFAGDAPSKGRIAVEIQRRDGEDSHPIGFVIRDNGIGLNDENMRSFCTSDSLFKAQRGGKGVGRLSWLKVFKHCEIRSAFAAGDSVGERTFNFTLDPRSPIKNHRLSARGSKGEIGTEVRLDGFYDPYESHCPKKAETIAAKIVGHFLPYLVVDRLPFLTLIDVKNSCDISDFYRTHQQRRGMSTVPMPVGIPLSGEPETGADAQEFHVHHVLLHKNLRFQDNGIHWIFYAANDRVVSQTAIDGQIGLKYVGEKGDCVYIGLVAGKFLDQHVNQERTGFSIAEEQYDLIHAAAVDSAKQFLSEYIEQVRALQKERAAKVIHDNPQFLPFREDLDKFVRTSLPLRMQNEEEIYVELSRHKLRRKRRLTNELSRAVKAGHSDKISQSVQQITQALNAEKTSSLAEYVVRRKEILELLDSSLAYRDPEERNYFKEEVVHELICPVRSSSDELDYDDHNLWILDDRLAFYTFFQSDRPFKAFIDGSASAKEPDIAVMFDRSLAFQREGKDEPIVIIEFKRPGRDDFDGNSNPVVQVLEYVDVFRSGKAVKDFSGKVIKPISSNTRFICYVIADFTDSLVKVVRSSIANHRVADGMGYFGYSEPHNAYVEVMPYAKMLADARVRNEAFFSRLGLI